MRHKKASNIIFFIAVLVVLAADQATKFWIRSIAGSGPIFHAGFFRILYTENTGAAFGILPNSFLLLSITAAIGTALILSYLFYFSRHFPSTETFGGKLALGLILGGTLGNLIDRLYNGFVTDFISVGIWPVFNVADSAVTVGIIVFLYYFFFMSDQEEKSAGTEHKLAGTEAHGHHPADSA